MKYVKPLFCLEILFVLVGCTRVYMKWDLPFICTNINRYDCSGAFILFSFSANERREK